MQYRNKSSKTRTEKKQTPQLNNPRCSQTRSAYAPTLIQTRLRHTLIQFSNPFTSQTNACTKKKKKKYRTRASRFPRYNFISSSVQCMFVLPHFPLLNWLGRTHIELWIFFKVMSKLAFQYSADVGLSFSFLRCNKMFEVRLDFFSDLLDLCLLHWCS